MNVLIIGRNSGIMSGLLRELEAKGFHARGCFTDHDAKRELEEGAFEAIAIGGGVEVESRRLIHEWAATLQPAAEVLDISGPQTLIPRLQALVARQASDT